MRSFLPYIKLFLRWSWLIILAAAIGGGASYYVRSQQPKQYRAQVTVSVGGFIRSQNPDQSQIRTGEALAQTYVVLAKTYDVLQATVDAGDFPVSPDHLRHMLDVRVVPDTSLVVMGVTYTNPVMAAAMADELSHQLILNSPTNLSEDQQEQLDLAQRERERISADLEAARERRAGLERQISEVASSPYMVEQLTAQHDELVAQINEGLGILAEFSTIVAGLQERTNILEIEERARVPNDPTGPGTTTTAAIGAIVGGGLVVILLLLLQEPDHTLQSVEQVEDILDLPVLGSVMRFGRGRNYKKKLIAVHNPHAPASEEYRILRTNLMLRNGGADRVLIVTSPGPREGKSITTANLAAVIAATGKRVLLVDADLRKPRQHEIFDLPNDEGLITLLTDEEVNDANDLTWDDLLGGSIQYTDVPNLRVMTSGGVASNPAEMLGSSLLYTWFQMLIVSDRVDIIIFDTPPTLIVADGAVLASTLKAPVVMVLQAGRTHDNAAIRAKDQLEQVEIDIKGVVLTRTSRSEKKRYGYSNSYYSVNKRNAKSGKADIATEPASR